MKSLIEAIHGGDTETAEQWLVGGASADCFDERAGENGLAIAAGRGDLAMVQLLLEHGADPNHLETTAWPLDVAAGFGHKEIVELLLEYDAEPEVQDEDNCTPLISAAAGGHLEIVELLLEAGSDPRRKDQYGKRPILFAAEKGHTAIVDVLAPLSTANDRRQADLMMKLAKQGPPNDAVRHFFEAAENGDIKAVQEYLKVSGEVDAMDQGGATALFWAARGDQLDVAKLLISQGANVNHIDTLGNFPLGCAGMLSGKASYEFLYEMTSQKLRDKELKAAKRAIKIGREKGFLKEADLAEQRFKETMKKMKKKTKKKR